MWNSIKRFVYLYRKKGIENWKIRKYYFDIFELDYDEVNKVGWCFLIYYVCVKIVNELYCIIVICYLKVCFGFFFCGSGNGISGRVVLYIIVNNGGCSDKWGKFLEIFKFNDVIDKELKCVLKYKF